MTDVNKILLTIGQASAAAGASTPYIVGGAPRDRIIGKAIRGISINDIDITTGDNTISIVSEVTRKTFPNASYRVYDDGHTSIDIGDLHIDFSSNFVSPGVKEELLSRGIENIDDMKLEMYSRDFTINTLLDTLDFGQMYEVCDGTLDDMKLNIIRCPVDPNITISSDPRRILRAIKFSIKYGFKIDKKLSLAMHKYREAITTLPIKSVQGKMNEIVRLDADKGIDRLIEYNLLSIVQPPKMILDILVQKRKLVQAL